VCELRDHIFLTKEIMGLKAMQLCPMYTVPDILLSVATYPYILGTLRNAIFRGIIPAERCCFAQLVRVVNSESVPVITTKSYPALCNRRLDELRLRSCNA
jgi:hypothetical protein